jgi:hypothetical protein
MNQYSCRVISVVFCFLASGIVSFAADDVKERAVLNEPLTQSAPLSGTMPRTAITAPTPTLEQTVAMLQQQVQALTAQVAALQSVLKVTPTGATLQAPSLSLLALESITVRSDKAVRIDSGLSLDMRSASTASLKTASSAVVEASGNLDLKGATIRHNGGGRPLAIVGSAVGNGQVLNGSSTVLGN